MWTPVTASPFAPGQTSHIALHDPRWRRPVQPLGAGWELRRADPRCPLGRRLCGAGVEPAQLWQAAVGLSVLTPSPLTGGAWELFPILGRRERVPTWPLADELVRLAHDVGLPALASWARLLSAPRAPRRSSPRCLPLTPEIV